MVEAGNRTGQMRVLRERLAIQMVISDACSFDRMLFNIVVSSPQGT
jgi:hypothetical protein